MTGRAVNPEHVILERRGRAAWLTLNRPQALNALDPSLADQLNAALDLIEGDTKIASVVVTGAGRAFCAGADLKFLNAVAEDERAEATSAFLAEAVALMFRLEAFEKPVIAAVNGVATGAGMELLLCCDLVVANTGARLGDSHANFGLLPGAGASVRLPRRIGVARAKYLFFTGDLISAREMLDAGLVNRVVPEDGLIEAAQALADKLATKSPLGLARMKELANRSWDLSQDEAVRLEQRLVALHNASHDRNEGLAAFSEGRTPVFLGR